MSEDPLLPFRIRAEVARATGEYHDYADDVSYLLKIIDGQRMVIRSYADGVERARTEWLRIKAEAALTDTSELLKADRLTMLEGARRMASAFELGDEP
jgi:hypothetical protein